MILSLLLFAILATLDAILATLDAVATVALVHPCNVATVS